MKQQSRNRVGVLHSLTGTMASAEMHLKDATRFLLQAICISTIWFLCWLRQVFLLPKCKFQSVVIIFLSLIIQVYLPSSVLAASEDANDIKRVLVVNSYHPGYSWSDDVMNGVRDVLEKEKGVEVFIEYLDTKRNTEETYLQQMERLILYKYENKDLDAIITSDDSALDLMLGIKEEYFSNVPLVFCGVDRDIERVSDFNSMYAVTGSKEGIRSTLDLILSLHPNIETVFFVSDESKTGRAKLETVRKMQPAYKETVRFDYLLNKSSGELQTALRQLPKKSVVFNLVFIRDALQKTFSIEEGMRLIGNNAKVPVYCSWGFQPGTGVVGGHINNGFTHGELSAQIAMKLLYDEDRESIPVIQKAPRTYMFDYTAMRRFNIEIKDIPKNSVVYNKAFSLYEEYRWRIIGAVIFVIVQTLLVAFLLINRQKRRQIELTLRESEEKYRSLIANIPDVTWTTDHKGNTPFVSSNVESVYGYKPEEIYKEGDRLWFGRIHPDDVEKVKDAFKVLFEKGIMLNIEYRIKRKDGKWIWLYDRSIATYEKDGIEYADGLFSDITERKRSEEALQAYQQRLKALASQLTITEEKERRRIAADLHDHIGQSLALARIQLAALLSASSKIETTVLVKDISRILLAAIQDTKNLIFELSSPSMNEIGLGAAISELLEEQIEKRYRLETEFIDNIDDSHRKVLAENVRAILFRNVRELLINVIKHAGGKKVSVVLEHSADILIITVMDDGVGFDPKEVFRGVKQDVGFGLFSIQERMADLGGALEIVSEPGKGCKAIMSVPIEKGVE